VNTIVLAEPTLVGRERELKELQQFLDGAIDGKGGTIFISGEAGSGKTRLTTEFLNLAKKQGVTILSGWCLSNAAVPYFPFVEAFDSYLSENEADKSAESQHLSLKTWLISPSQPEGSANQAEMSPQAWKDQRFAAVTKALLLMANNKPLILFIDDLHWADSASLSLLHYIARTVGPEKILVLATFRSEELSLNTEGLTHPLLDTLRLMGREDLFKEVKLINLSKPDVGRIAEDMLGGRVSEELVEKLAQESRGNPLFVIESLRFLFENGSLLQRSSKWQLAVDKLGIPTKVKDIILRRLGALKPNQRRTLDVASVIGDKFDPQLLGAVLSQDSLEVLETLNSVALSKSLVCVEGNYYRFDHAKSREVLYEEILLPLRQGYHERVAERIETLNGSAKQLSLSDLAYHYSQAGNKLKSLQFSLAAGKDALARFSNSEAIRHFKFVLQMIGAGSEGDCQKIAAMDALGDAFSSAGLFEEAVKTFESIACSVDSKSARLQALRKALMCCYWRGDSKRGLELANKAKEYESADKLEYARLQLYKGFVMGRSFGKPKEAIEDMTLSLKVFEEENSVPDIARGLAEISFAYPWVGRLEDSLSAAFRAVIFYKEIADMRQQAFAIGRLGTALGVCGFHQEALNAYSEANELDEKIGDYNTMAFHFMMSGIFLENLGDNKAAADKSLQGLKAAEKTDALYAKSLCYANLVREYAKLGQLELAEEYCKMLENLLDADAAIKSNVNSIAQAQLSKAVLLLSEHRWKEASESFEKCLTPNSFDGRAGYALALKKQGRTEEARLQLQKAKQLRRRIALPFEKSNIRAHLLASRNTTINEEIPFRLDIVNIGKQDAKIVEVKDLIPFSCNVLSLPAYATLDEGSIRLCEKEIDGLSTSTLKLVLIPMELGVFRVSPKIIYTDAAGGNLKTFAIDPITITIRSKTPITRSTATQVENLKLEFKSEASQKIFDYLVKTFNEDYLGMFPKERSGWRTLMDIIKKGKVSKHSVYGSTGKYGQAISELKRKGLIEVRVFVGERGRGGNIVKARIAYENTNVNQYIEQERNTKADQ
jgi:tetratricopeptide (TPR) repeat protein